MLSFGKSMRLIIILLLLLIGGGNISAQEPRLALYSENDQSFHVIINGVTQNLHNDNIVIINNIPAGEYSLKIKFADTDITENEVTIEISENKDHKFMIRTAQQNSFTLIKRKSDIDEILNTIEEVISTDYLDLNSVSKYKGKVGCPFAITMDQFDEVKKIIENKEDEEVRYSTAKQLIATNCMFVWHVREILLIFEEEIKKVDLAKYAYSYTHDIESYKLLSDIFNYESSVEELFEYISTL